MPSKPNTVIAFTFTRGVNGWVNGCNVNGTRLWKVAKSIENWIQSQCHSENRIVEWDWFAYRRWCWQFSRLAAECQRASKTDAGYNQHATSSFDAWPLYFNCFGNCMQQEHDLVFCLKHTDLLFVLPFSLSHCIQRRISILFWFSSSKLSIVRATLLYFAGVLLLFTPN